MSYNNQLFEISGFTKSHKHIFVTVQPHENNFQEKRLDKSLFESWLKKTDRLNVESGMFYHDSTCEICQIMIPLSLEQYYENEKAVCADLYDYLLLIGAENPFKSTFLSIQSICESFKN